MQGEVTDLRNIKILPYYRDLPIELSPTLVVSSGRYVDGRLLSHQFSQLVVDGDPEWHAEGAALQVGVPYTCRAETLSGAPFQTSWMYCTSASPQITFGLTRNWARCGAHGPLLGDASAPISKTEALTDLTYVHPAAAPGMAISQAQIGSKGWLVMSALGAPHLQGILIEDAELPPSLAEGSENITISARCERTLQTVALGGLTCVSARDGALFLSESTA